jgi:hypothetical protein
LLLAAFIGVMGFCFHERCIEEPHINQTFRRTLNIITDFIRYFHLILEPVNCVRGSNGFMVLQIIKLRVDSVRSDGKAVSDRNWQYKNA